MAQTWTGTNQNMRATIAHVHAGTHAWYAVAVSYHGRETLVAYPTVAAAKRGVAREWGKGWSWIAA